MAKPLRCLALRNRGGTQELFYANSVSFIHSFAGICGWFALESPVSATSSGHSASVNSTIVGGVEVSASFMNEEIRDLVVSSGLRHGWRPPSTGFFPAAGRAATPQMLQLPLRSGSGGGSGSVRIQMKEEKPCFDGKGIQFEIGVSHTSLWLSAVNIPTASRPTHKYCFLRYRFFDQSEFQESSVFFPKQRMGGCDLGWGLQPHQSIWSHPIPTSKMYLYCWANMPQIICLGRTWRLTIPVHVCLGAITAIYLHHYYSGSSDITKGHYMLQRGHCHLPTQP